MPLASAKPKVSKKLHQSVGCFLRLFLEDPMAGVFQHHDCDISRDELHLRGQLVAKRFVAADRQHRHRQFCLRELGEIFGQLRPRNEIGPAGMHSSRLANRLAVYAFRSASGIE